MCYFSILKVPGIYNSLGYLFGMLGVKWKCMVCLFNPSERCGWSFGCRGSKQLNGGSHRSLFSCQSDLHLNIYAPLVNSLPLWWHCLVHVGKTLEATHCTLTFSYYSSQWRHAVFSPLQDYTEVTRSHKSHHAVSASKVCTVPQFIKQMVLRIAPRPKWWSMRCPLTSDFLKNDV